MQTSTNIPSCSTKMTIEHFNQCIEDLEKGNKKSLIQYKNFRDYNIKEFYNMLTNGKDKL